MSAPLKLLGRACYLGQWFLRARCLGRTAPLQTVLFVSDVCNLACKHCNILRRDGSQPVSKSFAQISEELAYAHGPGSRFVDFSGGEPFIWQDRSGEQELDINDLIRQARALGFYSVTVTSNGQQPLAGCLADSIWVSLDGVGPAHDQVRGPGTFTKLLANIEGYQASGQRQLNVNMVINRLNYRSVRETVEFAAAHPAIQAISLNFHTPFPGTEELLLPQAERSAIIDELIQLKKSGYPVMNSVSGLKAMRTLAFKPRCWISNFILADGSRLRACPGQPAGLCGQCGFSMAGEMSSLFAGKPDTILGGLRLRLPGRSLAKK